MLHVFADENYLSRQRPWTVEIGEKAIQFEKTEEFFIYAAIALGTKARLQADELLAHVKAKHRVPTHLPLKWNFKDSRVRDFYEAHGALKTHERLCSKEMNAVRDEILEGLAEIQVRRVFGIIVEKYGASKERRDIREMALVNLLQRVGAYKRWMLTPGNVAARVVVDYPESDMGTLPFNIYHDACVYGRDRYENTFSCGPLAACGFDHGLLYGSALTNPMLQLADMVTGSVTDFFSWALKGAAEKRVNRFFTKLLPLFHRKTNGEIIPYGLAMSTSRNVEIAAKLKEVEARAAKT